MIPAPRGSGAAFVTGAGGFVGGAVAAALRVAGWRVVGFDLRDGGDWRTGPVTSEALAQAAGEAGAPELIMHAAGPGSVGVSVTDPAGDFDACIGSLRQTLEFMRVGAPAARLIFPSSAAVYGEGFDTAIPEGAPLRPVSPYGLHKVLAEQLIAGWAGMFDLDVAVVRFFSLYGPGLRKQLLWDIARRIGDGAEALELSGSGDEARDFLHVDDAVALIGRLAALPRGVTPPVVNGGTGAPVTVRAAAEAVAAAMGFAGPVRFNGLVRAGDPRLQIADIAEATRLGIAAQVGFEVGAAGFARWAGGELSKVV